MASQLDNGHSPPLAPTKIRAPITDERNPRRGRVDALLDSGNRVSLVIAPAGYGKTTAVAQWAAHRAHPIAWFTVDVHDNSAPRFWRYVAAAIRRAVPEVGDETLAVIDDWALDGIDMVSALLAELGDEREPMALVMDDLHHISSPKSPNSWRSSSSGHPPGCTSCSSRELLPRFRSPDGERRGSSARCAKPTSSCRPTKPTRRSAEMPFVRLSATGEEHLIGLAAGWPAALQLAALSLRDRDDADELVEANLKGQRLLFDYVVGEVLDRLPAVGTTGRARTVGARRHRPPTVRGPDRDRRR